MDDKLLSQFSPNFVYKILVMLLIDYRSDLILLRLF